MNYKQIKVYIICLTFTASSTVFAQQVSSGSSNPVKSGATAVQIKSNATQATPVQSGAFSAGNNPSMNNAANQSRDKNMAASIVSGVVGAGMMAMGVYYVKQATACKAALGSCSGPLYAMAAASFMMGAMSLQQAATNLSSSKSASGTANTTASNSYSSWGNIGENVGEDPLANPALRNLIDVDKVKQGIAEAKKMGIDGKNSVKIDGKEFKPSDFSSPQAMATAGLSPDIIKSSLATTAKLEKEAIKRLGAQTAALGYDESAAAAPSTASVPSAYGTDSGPTPSGYARVPRDPASINVAGLTKNFNGDPIGVAADSIFQMMTRRYKLKEKQNSFIDDTTVNLQK